MKIKEKNGEGAPKNKKSLHSFLVPGLLLSALLLVKSPCLAAAKDGGYQDSRPDDYVTKQFDVTAVFDRTHTASITEKIIVDFRQGHHGIVRNIPVAEDNTYEIKNISVDDYHYTVEESDSNTAVRIGDEDKTLTGEHAYLLSYQIEYFKDADGEADFLAQNMLPTEWETSIRESVLTITMPEAIDPKTIQIYAGAYGEDDQTAWKDYFKATTNGNTLILKGKNLPEGYGLSIRDTQLADGYWSEARSFVDAHKTGFLFILVISAISGILVIPLWVMHGRDSRIIETVEFYPPDGLTPAEIGYALDEKLEDSEMMTTILYLADKKYIAIEPEKNNFILSKEKDPGEDEPTYVKTFFHGLFKKRKRFNTGTPPQSFREPFETAKTEAEDCYKERYSEVFTVKSCLSRYACLLLMAINMAVFCMVLDGFDGLNVALVLGALSLWGVLRAWDSFDNIAAKRGKGALKLATGVIMYAAAVLILAILYDYYPVKSHIYAFLASEAVIFLISLVMQKRTDENSRLTGKIYGFRRFIKEAEYDRILTLCDSDPEYFYHILPYAAVLGLETEWTKHFENIKIPQPEWYHSKGMPFLYSGLWCSQLLDSCTKNAVPSSGSSGGYSGGSSGGGFSGGGGGGGGGGAW